MFFLRKDQHLNVVIYADGRTHVTHPDRPTFTQAMLIKIAHKAQLTGAWKQMQPGRYRLTVTKNSLFHSDFELNPVEDQS